MATPKVLILRAPGTNCDVETQFAFETAGAFVERLHIQRLREDPAQLQRFQILVIPGGFSYGDDVGAGKILANQLSHFLEDSLRKFRDADKLILGVCNGFQAILKAGLLIPPDEDGPLATLAHNTHGYQDRWLHLKKVSDRCVFLKEIDTMEIPMAHGEGRFQCREDWIAEGLEQAGQVVLKYVDSKGNSGAYPVNPNGSQNDVAGVCDVSGRVLGLMPHPERHLLPVQHPRWTREGLKEKGDGLKLFQNAVEYFTAD
jgi:phosphoribosylformylglycinamidine synthase subunit PurQ / glutaminase